MASHSARFTVTKQQTALTPIQCTLPKFPTSLGCRGFPGGLVVQNPLATQKMQETQVWSLGQEYALEEGMATHSSIPAWRIPCTEEPSGVQSTGSQRVRHEWRDWSHTCTLGCGGEIKQGAGDPLGPSRIKFSLKTPELPKGRGDTSCWRQHHWTHNAIFADNFMIFLIEIQLTYNIILVSGVQCVAVAQSCPTLCDPMGFSPPGSSVHGLL